MMTKPFAPIYHEPLLLSYLDKLALLNTRLNAVAIAMSDKLNRIYQYSGPCDITEPDKANNCLADSFEIMYNSLSAKVSRLEECERHLATLV